LVQTFKQNVAVTGFGLQLNERRVFFENLVHKGVVYEQEVVGPRTAFFVKVVLVSQEVVEVTQELA